MQVSGIQEPAPAEQPSWGYRPAIDGLRAIAVVSVFLFHFDRKLLGGGFVGVDVFFAISGYLITSILLQDIAQKTFSIAKFYQRRMARIFPAFFLTIGVTLVFSAFIYSAQDFASLGANATAATFSVINFKLLFQGNYFALSEDAQPILHYWSLAVEEQYYILFPVYLHLLMRHSRRPLAINLLVCSASFVACVAATYLNSAYAFYLLPTRAWELLAGSSLAIYERSRGGLNFGANAAALPGLALLAVSFFVLKENSHFPGWIAFMPVTGAVLVLSAATQTQSLPIRLLSHSLPVWLGRLSYSLYLWHWPVFSLVDYRFFEAGSAFRATLKIALTLVLSVLTYLYVERPLRESFGKPARRNHVFTGMAATIAILAAFGIYIRGAYHIDAAPNQIETGGVVVNSGQNRTVVLAGDSQASMYGTALADLAREMGFTLYVLSMDGRNELPEEPGTYWPAVASFIIQRQPDVVVMAIYGQTSSVTIPGRCKPHCRTSTDVQSASYC